MLNSLEWLGSVQCRFHDQSFQMELKRDFGNCRDALWKICGRPVMNVREQLVQKLRLFQCISAILYSAQ